MMSRMPPGRPRSGYGEVRVAVPDTRGGAGMTPAGRGAPRATAAPGSAVFVGGAGRLGGSGTAAVPGGVIGLRCSLGAAFARTACASNSTASDGASHSSELDAPSEAVLFD